jgi:hypothetical protein
VRCSSELLRALERQVPCWQTSPLKLALASLFHSDSLLRQPGHVELVLLCYRRPVLPGHRASFMHAGMRRTSVRAATAAGGCPEDAVAAALGGRAPSRRALGFRLLCDGLEPAQVSFACAAEPLQRAARPW